MLAGECCTWKQSATVGILTAISVLQSFFYVVCGLYSSEQGERETTQFAILFVLLHCCLV